MGTSETSTQAKSPVTTRFVDLPPLPKPEEIVTLLKQYGCGPVPFAGADNGLYERHLLFDNVTALERASVRDRSLHVGDPGVEDRPRPHRHRVG